MTAEQHTELLALIAEWRHSSDEVVNACAEELAGILLPHEDAKDPQDA